MNPATTRLAPVDARTLPPYSPTTYVDFSQPGHRAEFEAALAQVRAGLGRTHPLVIGGRRIEGGPTFESLNPAKPSEVIGRFASGTKEQAAEAVEVASRTFATWSRVPAAERAAYLVEAAKRMRERRHEFSAWMVLRGRQELGRGRRRHRRGDRLLRVLRARDAALRRAAAAGADAGRENNDASTCRSASAWSSRRGTSRSRSCAGMTTAAIVTGNTVVLKPSSDSPTIAATVLRADGRSRPAAGRAQLRPRAGRRRSATRWSTIRRRASSPSPARRRSACASTSSPPTSQPGQIWIKRSSPRWAARTRSSSTTRPISTPPRPGVVAVRVRLPGAEVLGVLARDRGRRRSTTQFLEKLVEAHVAKIPIGDPAR